MTKIFYRYMIIKTRFLVLLLPLFSCNFSKGQYSSGKFIISGRDWEYNLKEPDKKWDLDNDLEEISGLSMVDDNTLACVNDEQGHVFYFDIEEGEISGEEDFGKKGDYEGLELVNNVMWVTESNGELYKFSINEEGKIDGKTKSSETILDSKNNVEGLGYHLTSQKLMIACKERPGEKKDDGSKRAIYLRDPKSGDMDVKYIMTDDVEKILKEKDLSTKKHIPFLPSGIAMNPITHEIFVIAHRGKLMMILSEDFKLLDVAPLPKKLLPQPEGICFDSKGNLYLSSEGAGGDGVIVRYD